MGVLGRFRDFFLKAPGSPRREIFLYALMLLVGVAAGLTIRGGALVWLALGLGLGLVLVVVKKPGYRFLILLVALGLIGGFRGSLAMNSFLERAVSEELWGQESTLVGTVRGYPELTLKTQKYYLEVEAADRKTVTFKIQVTDNLYPEVQNQDHIQVRCKLAEASFGALNFGSLASGIRAKCVSKETVVLEPAAGVQKILNLVRGTVRKTSERTLSEPQASLFQGLVYGADAGLPKDLQDDFRRAGLSHLVAVSGSNIGIIITNLLLLLIAFWLPRKRAIIAVFGALLGYLLIVGFEASLLRAAMMGSLILLAAWSGRGVNSRNILAVSVAGLIFVTPFLFFSLGFQLSVLATFGILFLEPRLRDLGKFLPDVRGLRQLFSTNLSAQIMTLPLLSLMFGRISLVGFLANLIVVPLVSFIFPLCFALILLALISAPLAVFISYPFILILTLILFLAKIMSAVPYAELSWNLTFFGAAAIYAAIIYWLGSTDRSNYEPIVS
ncbi:MAG: ComEC/Rec2 family competence protein [bacterium]